MPIRNKAVEFYDYDIVPDNDTSLMGGAEEAGEIPMWYGPGTGTGI